MEVLRMDVQAGRAPFAPALALELHDTVGATLFALRAAIERIADEPYLDPATQARLAVVKGHARDAAAAVRGFARTLGAPAQHSTLAVALREQCRALTERSDVEAGVVILTDLPPMPPASTNTLIEAVRACLLHVERHARARFVAVSAFAVRDGVGVAVSNDGPGPAAGGGRRNGRGMTQLAGLMARAGGTVSSGPSEDSGVVVQLWMPA
jgi:signal transduction histidine kinase